MNIPQLTVKVPKYFYIPTRGRHITAGEYVALYRFCKANPGVLVKETIEKWWGGTTDDVLNEIRTAIHHRIYLRGQMGNSSANKYNH